MRQTIFCKNRLIDETILCEKCFTCQTILAKNRFMGETILVFSLLLRLVFCWKMMVFYWLSFACSATYM